MKVLIVGSLNGRLTAATKLALDKGATIAHVVDIGEALAALRAGYGADLLVVDAAVGIGELVRRLDAEQIHGPIVACGTATEAQAAAATIRDGAKGYIPLPADPKLIAAVLAAVADDTRDPIYWDDATAGVIKLAQQVASADDDATQILQAVEPVCRALVGRTVSEVERDLILETLKHCLGNRTHAANLLGISIRTLRNKLNEYTAAGLSVPPPGGSASSEARKAA
ncbi:MAG: helix-turn-helix domain-containing protein [Xanthobacteraceae bacterium]